MDFPCCRARLLVDDAGVLCLSRNREDFQSFRLRFESLFSCQASLMSAAVAHFLNPLFYLES